jgi:lipoprotein-releasing system ATP-binding protein
MADASHAVPASPSALALAGLERTYMQGENALHVLRGVDLELAPGEIVGLVGPSGAGKSTLLHIAGLLEQPDAGEVYVDGIDTTRMDDRQRTAVRREQIGFVYQFHHLLPEFTALENVVLPQRVAGLGRREAEVRAAELLTFLGLGERQTHRPGELSGGEQQRVAIARAVANADTAGRRADRQPRSGYRRICLRHPATACSRHRTCGADRDSQSGIRPADGSPRHAARGATGPSLGRPGPRICTSDVLWRFDNTPTRCRADEKPIPTPCYPCLQQVSLWSRPCVCFALS